MQPYSLSFITYKKAYLGTPKNLFGFVKRQDAIKVKQFLKYENFHIKEGQQTFFLAPPQTRLKKPLNIKQLMVRTMDAEKGMFFGTINNMEISVIDEVKQVKEDVIRLDSNYVIDSDFFDDQIHLNHLNDIFEGKQIDYTMKLEEHQLAQLAEVFELFELFEDEDDE